MKFLNNIDAEYNTLIRPAWAIKTVSTTYSIDPETDEYIFCNAGGGAFSVTLPSAIGLNGIGYTIKKIDNTSSPITINTTSSQTIDGNTSQIIRNKNALKIVSDGNNWFVV